MSILPIDVRQAVVLLALGLAVLALLSWIWIRLYRRVREERDGRIELQRRRHWTDLLQQLTSGVSKATSPAAVMDTALLEFLHAIDGAAGLVVLIADEGQTGHLARLVGYEERLIDPHRQFAMAAVTPLADAVRLRGIITVDPQAPPTVDPIEPHIRELLAIHKTFVAIPLLAGRDVDGVLGIGFQDVRIISSDEEQFLITAARRTGEALARARLYQTAEQARAAAEHHQLRADEELRERQRAEQALRESETKYRALATQTRRLYTLSAALSESITLDAVARAVVRHGKIVVGASAGSVALLVDGGTSFETLYAEPGDRDGIEGRDRFPVEPGLYSTAAVQTRQPIFVGSFEEWRQRYPRSASMDADGGFASVAALPLTVKEAPIGVLAFQFTAPVSFDQEYCALLVSVAQHCAQAIDRARLYDAAQRGRVDAEAANRSKDDFLSTVSHELRTPLTAVLGWAFMLRKGSLGEAREKRAIEAICNSAARQAELIDELLDVSRIVAGRAVLDLQEVDLRDSIRGAVDAVMPLAEAKGLELGLGPHPMVPVVADPRRLEQIFLNLLSNAVKFTPPGGCITVDVAQAGQIVNVRVADNGPGIEREFLPYIFDRFRQAESHTTRSVGGLGLGLFIARQLVEAQGGSIRAESAGSGTGATFVVSLPVTNGRHARRPVSAEPIHAGGPPDPAETSASLQGVRVLLVDDEPDVCELMEAALERSGATVTAVRSAPEALVVLAKGEVDVLLADIAMPEKDGYELIREVRALSQPRVARIPAAAVTACARDDERQRALAAGFHMHLAKPIEPDQLVKAVANLARSTASC